MFNSACPIGDQSTTLATTTLGRGIVADPRTATGPSRGTTCGRHNACDSLHLNRNFEIAHKANCASNSRLEMYGEILPGSSSDVGLMGVQFSVCWLLILTASGVPSFTTPKAKDSLLESGW